MEGDGAPVRLPLPVGTVGGGAADHHLRPPPPPAGPAPAPARRPGPPPAVQQDGGARSPRPPLCRWGRGFCTALPPPRWRPPSGSRHFDPGTAVQHRCCGANGEERDRSRGRSLASSALQGVHLPTSRSVRGGRAIKSVSGRGGRRGVDLPRTEGRGSAGSVQHDSRACLSEPPRAYVS